MTPRAPLSEVCSLITDGTHYTPPAIDRGVPFLTVKDMSERDLAFDSAARISTLEFARAQAGNSAPRVGDVLFSKDGTVGKVHVVTEPRSFAVLSSIAILRPRAPVLDPGYLAHALRSPSILRSAVRLQTGTAIRRVILSDLKRIRVPLPPIEEQRQIARRLDAIEVLRGQRRDWLARLNTLTAAAFVDIFGELETNPRRWKVGPVADYVAAFSGGRSFAGIDANGQDSPFSVLRVSAVTSGRLRTSERRPLPEDYHPPPAHLVRPGDLLISRANTTELVGAVALVDQEAPRNLVLPDKIWRFEWRDPATTCPEFVWQLFRSPHTRREIARRATGTSGSMKNIAASKLLAIRTIQPPLEAQRQFARIVRTVLRVRASGEAHLLHLDALFASTQHRAFTGAA